MARKPIGLLVAALLLAAAADLRSQQADQERMQLIEIYLGRMQFQLAREVARTPAEFKRIDQAEARELQRAADLERHRAAEQRRRQAEQDRWRTQPLRDRYSY